VKEITLASTRSDHEGIAKFLLKKTGNQADYLKWRVIN
jgi:hypothetical protein